MALNNEVRQSAIKTESDTKEGSFELGLTHTSSGCQLNVYMCEAGSSISKDGNPASKVDVTIAE